MESGESILIACSRLVDLAGAEVATLELAEAFSGMGWTVSLASFELGGDVCKEVQKMHIHHFDLSDTACFSPGLKFDLAWIHHAVAANRTLADQNLLLDKVIFSSLSHFNAMECPPDTRFPLSRYLVHSQENLEFFISNYPELRASVGVMNNSVLAKYWKSESDDDSNRLAPGKDVRPRAVARELSSLAVVSNHLPDETVELIGLLQAEGVNVEVFGATARRVRVTPDVLRQYDAVMTIGKTVQYGFAAKVPVYCYDHFGGDGWVKSGNFEQGRTYNFSGRGGRGRIAAERIRRELFDGYPEVIQDVDNLYELGRKYFVLEKNLESILKGIPRYSPPVISSTSSNILIRGCGIFVDSRKLIAYRDDLISDLYHLLDDEKSNAREQIEYRDALVAELRGQLDEEKSNAQKQVEYRDALVSELRGQLDEEKSNAQKQIEYRDALVAELRRQLDEEKSNAQKQVEYRDALVEAMRRRPIKFAIERTYSKVLHLFLHK